MSFKEVFQKPQKLKLDSEPKPSARSDTITTEAKKQLKVYIAAPAKNKR